METVNLQVSGSGTPLVLLHGFPFDHSLWDGFKTHLPGFRIVTPDLPGFGASELPAHPFSIADTARLIIARLLQEGIHDYVLVGHSLGGYVALAMIAEKPEDVLGLVMLHSTARADNEEKRASRDKSIEFVREHGAPAFTGKFIDPLFAVKSDAVEKVRHIAKRASAGAVTGYLNAMKLRTDMTETLKGFGRPVLFITGEKDPGIPVESIREQAALSPAISVAVLENIGHMGMFEAPEKTADLLRNFAGKVTGGSKK